MIDETMTMDLAEEIVESTNTESYLTFESDGLTFGVSTNYVNEIITNYMLRPLPMVPNYIKGIINLRGQIIPIIDIRLRMGKPETEPTSHTCIIILDIEPTVIGIIVDSVSQVVDIDASESSSIPTENHQELANSMISLGNDRVVLLLNCEAITTP